MPANLLAAEARRLFETKQLRSIIKEDRKLAKSASMSAWQQQWDSSDKGRWTYRLIPNIETWSTRKHGETNFHLTQLLSGHGCYRKYLYRFGHDESPYCPACFGEEEDAEHVFFKCPRFETERTEAFQAIRINIIPENIVVEMMKSESAWDAVSTLAKKVNESLRISERLRRSNQSRVQQI